jgi:hypothetical protein
VSNDKIVVGKVSKTAVLPEVSSGWRVILKAIEGDGENCLLTIKRGSGLMVIVR